MQRNEFVWWPKFWLRNHGVVYNLVFLSEPGRATRMFLLEFPEGPRNRASVNLPRIQVPEHVLQSESLLTYVRRQAAA